MKIRSLRVKLTAWYLAVLFPATLVCAATGWWLVRRSVIDSADANLRARIEGVRVFINSSESVLPHEELQDELCEYVQLAEGGALLEIKAASGTLHCGPATPEWKALDPAPATADAATVIADRTFHGEPVRVAATTIAGPKDRYRVVLATSMSGADAALDRFRFALLWFVPLLLAGAGVGGYWIAGRSLAPVDRMARDVQAITVRNLDRRLEVAAEDEELKRLAVTFNSMLSRLHASVADMTRLTAEASHELRTPIALIRATADLALERERTSTDYREALRDVLDESTRMSRLVDDLLMLARADAGVDVVEHDAVDLRASAADAVKSAQAVMAVAAVSCQTTLPSDPVTVSGSAASLRRLCTILLDNAIKYSPAGRDVRVTVAVGAAGDGSPTAVLEVVDQGIGLDPGDVPHVFDRFFRGAAARERAADGSGLGLSIAKTLVERYQGSIQIEPRRDMTGCRVRVSLPLLTLS